MGFFHFINASSKPKQKNEVIARLKGKAIELEKKEKMKEGMKERTFVWKIDQTSTLAPVYTVFQL